MLDLLWFFLAFTLYTMNDLKPNTRIPCRQARDYKFTGKNFLPKTQAQTTKLFFCDSKGFTMHSFVAYKAFWEVQIYMELMISTPILCMTVKIQPLFKKIWTVNIAWQTEVLADAYHSGLQYLFVLSPRKCHFCFENSNMLWNTEYCT